MACFLPTSRWPQGKAVGDQYRLDLPRTMPGESTNWRSRSIVRTETISSRSMLKANHWHGGGTRIHFTSKENKQPTRAYQVEMASATLSTCKSSACWIRVESPGLCSLGPGQLDCTGVRAARRRVTKSSRWQFARRGRPDCNRTERRPANGTYPTTDWNSGEVLLDWHDWILPSSTAQGRYRLVVTLTDPAGGW